MTRTARRFAGLVAALCLSGPLLADGVVYVTNSLGQTVPFTSFDTAPEVYLAAGPGPGQPCNGLGIANGDWYFQVTTFANDQLLTTDALEHRRVTVQNGVFATYVGTRATAPGPCSSLLLQLMPFTTLPGTNLDYRVWATPVANYDPGLGGVFGFLPEHSRTVVFKVRNAPQDTRIRGEKFFDFNANGTWDASVPEEVAIPGWRFELWRNGVRVAFTFTDAAGGFEFLQPQDGASYEVRDIPPPPGYIPNPEAFWHPTTSITRGASTNASLVDVGDFGAISFNEEPTTGISTSKGYWHNAGMPVLRLCDPLWRETVNGPQGNPLCLRRPISSNDPSVSIFTVPLAPASFTTAYFHLSNYLTSRARGHAGYILSVQVCATALNRACGPFSQYSLVTVDVRGDGRLTLVDDLLQNVRTLLCDPRAGRTGPGENEDLRALMFGCLNEFEQLNSESGATHTPTTRPKSFSSPYAGIE
ncbi:MAG: hypothetical protein JNM84_12385 [Planctomycetes bacterium]|nr:hypothetical protein [Planctomycetota bacterium]